MRHDLGWSQRSLPSLPPESSPPSLLKWGGEDEKRGILNLLAWTIGSGAMAIKERPAAVSLMSFDMLTTALGFFVLKFSW